MVVAERDTVEGARTGDAPGAKPSEEATTESMLGWVAPEL